jgi:hypothetical protein
MYEENVRFISHECYSLGDESRIIMLSHHLPSFKQIHSFYKDKSICFGYASNLEDMMKKPMVAWLHGHTHYPIKNMINGVEINCNPCARGIYTDKVFTLD